MPRASEDEPRERQLPPEPVRARGRRAARAADDAADRATEVGLRLYQHGRSICNELRAAEQSIPSLGRTLQGRVRLSVPSGYGQMVMSDWLLDFKQQHPGIVLEVRFENRVDDLLREEVRHRDPRDV